MYVPEGALALLRHRVAKSCNTMSLGPLRGVTTNHAPLPYVVGCKTTCKEVDARCGAHHRLARLAVSCRHPSLDRCPRHPPSTPGLPQTSRRLASWVW